MTEQGMGGSSADPKISETITTLNQPLRARVDAVEQANQRALDKAEHERDRAMEDLRSFLVAKIEAADEKLGVRIEALRDLTHQYQEQQKYALEVASEEREKSALTLREEVEKTAQVLREATERDIKSGDDQLRQHIEHQRDQVNLSFAASKEAISKAEVATEKRFEQIEKSLDETKLREERFLPKEFRELVDANILELREGRATNAELIHQLSLRLTEFEARGGGEKDHAADLKSTVAIAISALVGVAAIVISLITLLGGG